MRLLAPPSNKRRRVSTHKRQATDKAAPDYPPAGDKAVSLMDAPSAMLRVVAAQTQSL